ncbi:AAA family ATPase [Imperialibacter sp.]|uniref:ATP-dependent DNA helicase n=1 Tax=Imperialibacter sp. TaxID=2038411 RepID=UPI0032EC081B
MPLPSEVLERRFPFAPTNGQRAFMGLLDELLNDEKPGPQILLLRGYAGTGKTTLVSQLVNVLPLFNRKYSLLAPTGRAAKVMSGYAKRSAFTIHKVIYKQTSEPGSQNLKFSRQKNYQKDTIFIVDEASMLSNESDFGQNGLLADLMEYVFEKETNRLILVGDVAQLPPVGQIESPAMSSAYLRSQFHVDVKEVELTEVLRQEKASGILENATALRELIKAENYPPKFITRPFKDIFRMTSEKLEEGLRYAYDKFGQENTIIICRSNKSAVMYNQYIRRQIHFMEDEINAGDILLATRNNYFYFPEDAPGGFLANGDFVEIMKIISFQEAYGFRFADLELRMIDYDAGRFEAKVLLESLHAPTPSIGPEDHKKLYEEVLKDYEDLANKKERAEALKKDPFLNALQVKFAYALTCHKSQGGQWKAVFVDQGYVKDDMINQDFVRWLYTAVTRATDEVFLVNFDAKFFGG